MVVEKILTPPTVQGQIDKINEIIDYLRDSENTSYVASCPALTPLEGVVTWTVTHNLGTSNVSAFVYSSAGLEIMKDVSIVSDNAVTISFDSADVISAGAYKVVVFASGGVGSGGSGGGSADDTYTNQSLNVTFVGTVVENKGVLSGFSANNVANTTEVFAPASNSWEQVWCFTTGSDVLTSQNPIGRTADGYEEKVMLENGVLFLALSSNNSSWNISRYLEINTASPNTKYWLKIEFTGSAYNAYLSTSRVFSNTPDLSITSSEIIYQSQPFCIGNQFNTYHTPWLGSIDLNECYINISGSRWWTGAEHTELTGLSPVTDYYVSGSSWYKETFSDATRTKRIWLEQGGVASSSTATINLLKNFSNTNYTVTGGATNKTTSSFKLTSNANWVAIGV